MTKHTHWIAQIRSIHTPIFVGLVFFIPLVFLLVGILTLSDYGFNWDEPYHFYRGQAYFHFFRTGSKDYSDLPKYPRLNIKRCEGESFSGDCNVSPPPPSDFGDYQDKETTYEKAIGEHFLSGSYLRRSFFQRDSFTFNEAVKSEDGHPPLGGIIAAFTNNVFYQRFKILDDIEAHHLGGILISFLGLLAVAIFTYRKFGLLASIVSSASISLYPLFFSESHFNVKDPLVSSFIGIAIVFFYFGIFKRKWYFITLSSVSAGLGLGVKFNALFLPFIIVPWLLFFLLKKPKLFSGIFKNKVLLASLITYPIIALFTFYIIWPYLWPDPIGNIQKTINYYQTSGTGTPGELKNFLFLRFNTFPITWIILTTPIPILVLTAIGLFRSLYYFLRRGKEVYLLIILWFLIPIIRVSLPNTAINGGVRQIMEFVLPLGVLAGVGAIGIVGLIEKGLKGKRAAKKVAYSIIFVFLTLVLVEIIRIHPNQNVYFNQLIGGLSGAREKGIPYWGNSYGNAYLQGVNWLNENAGPNAKLGLPIATMANIPRHKLRSDIDFDNGHWSGTNRGGEYEMELIHDYTQMSWYGFAYYDTYLDPVYEVKVDGVPLLKVWKNDLEHTRPGFEEEISYYYTVKESDKGRMVLDIGRLIFLTSLKIEHSTQSCQEQKGGHISLSQDGEDWVRESEPTDTPQVPPAAIGWDEDTFMFLFPAKVARYISVDTGLEDPCIFKNPLISVTGLKQRPD